MRKAPTLRTVVCKSAVLRKFFSNEYTVLHGSCRKKNVYASFE